MVLLLIYASRADPKWFFNHFRLLWLLFDIINVTLSLFVYWIERPSGLSILSIWLQSITFQLNNLGSCVMSSSKCVFFASTITVLKSTDTAYWKSTQPQLLYVPIIRLNFYFVITLILNCATSNFDLIAYN